MKYLDIQAAIGTAIILLAFPCESKHAHSVNHLNILGKRHQQHKRAQSSARALGLEHGLQKRGTCTFPEGEGLVAVTPGSDNAGWAMSPDQKCTPDSFCPYACPSGKVMAQWNPEAINYPDPKSMDGGLYCNKDGEIIWPFDNKPLCVDGTGTVGAQNKCKGKVSFCQTVLPGNEAMIIPTEVDSWTQLAVPGPDYWLSTAAHYYINYPGIGVDKACIWGDGVEALGNWSPFVGGANTKADGTTFSMISWNPIYLGSWHAKTPPTFGVKIECVSGDCIGTPCSIDPSKDGVGGVTSGQTGSGADNAKFCVVTVPKGGKANIVTFPVGDSEEPEEEEEPTKAAEPSKTPKPTPKPEPTTTTKATTTTQAPTTKKKEKSDDTESTSTESSDTASASSTGFMPHILFEKTNYTSSSTTEASTKASATLSATAEPASSPSKDSGATAVSGSMFSFLVVFAAAAYIL